MRKLSGFILSGFIVISGLSGLLAITAPTPVNAACQNRLLSFPAWHNGLTKSNCDIKDIDEDASSGSSTKITLRAFITRVILNVTEIVLQLVGYASVAMIMLGGFYYITSTGDSSKMSSAKNTILNAVIGLVISLFAVAIVNVVARAI